VKHPKSNGYEALHCTLLSPSGIWVEVQIRTKRMDDIAEKGIAAHWAYKKNGYIAENDGDINAWLQRIKEILVDPDVNALELLDLVHSDLTTSEIYVFTPKGEQKSIQKDATVLDFAYLIHTEIGNKAIAAKVNQRLVPLSHVIKTGDQIEIITAEEEHPKPEWLHFLKTHRAQTVVQDYIRNERRQTAEYGRKTLIEEVEGAGFKWNEATLAKLLNACGIDKREELFYRVGLGTQPIPNLQEVLKPSSGFSLLGRIFRRQQKKQLEENTGYVIGGESGHHFVIASCCNPIPGDPVVGFKGPDGAITVHKKSCPVAESIAATHGDWMVVPSWIEDNESNSFLVRISLKGIDRMGMVKDISSYLSVVMGANIRGLTLTSQDGIFDGFIDLYVSSRDVLEKIIHQLSAIEGIKEVSRSEL
jgi:GTP pyrophosphokinase